MEQSNNSSNSATVGGEPNDINSECKRVLETMKFYDMPYHANAAPVHSPSGSPEWQPSSLGATRPTSQAAAASAAIPSGYYPHPYIGTGTCTGADVGDGPPAHHHLGTESTSYQGREPASSRTSKDNIIQLPHSNDV